MRRSIAACGLVCALASVACGGSSFVQIAAPPAPRAELPRGVDPLPLPPEPGLTRVTLDANGEPARVSEVLDQTTSNGTGWGAQSVSISTYSENTKPICVTPCEADFKPGLHILHFSAENGSSDARVDVQVGKNPKVVRVAFGHTTLGGGSSHKGILLQGLGFATALIGGSLWLASGISHDQHSKDLKNPGIGMVVGGVAAIGIGIPLSFTPPTTFQPSSTTQFTPAVGSAH